jgi:hypothetical protein
MMLIAAAAAFLGSFSTLQALPAATTAPAAAPLREIVYKFSYDQTKEYTTEAFGAPPQSSTTPGGFSGTMTVDVLAADTEGYLKAEIHEATDALNGKAPFDAVFVIHPDGTLVAVSGSYDDSMTSLLPYLGRTYFADHPLTAGSTWETDTTADTLQLATTYTVTKVDGDNTTVQALTAAKQGVVNGSLKVETKVVYKAPKLVPITLDIMMTRSGGGDTASAVQSTHYHFDRASDTMDPPATAH